MGVIKVNPVRHLLVFLFLMLIFLFRVSGETPSVIVEKDTIMNIGESRQVINAQDTITVITTKPEKLLRNIDFRDLTIPGFNFWEDEFSGHWAGVDFGLNTFQYTNYQGYESRFLKNNLFRSNSLFINPFQHSFGLGKNNNTIGVVTGLGLWLESYRIDKNTTIEKLPNGTIIPKTLIFDDNQKSKFSMVYITLPLLFEVQIPTSHYKNRAFISGGFLGGYRLGSHTKIKYRFDRKKEKLKTPGDFSLYDFRYCLMLRGGYHSFQLFAISDLRPLFRKDTAPEVIPFTFGVTLLSF